MNETNSNYQNYETELESIYSTYDINSANYIYLQHKYLEYQKFFGIAL